MRHLLLALTLAGCAGEASIETATAPLRPDTPGTDAIFSFAEEDENGVAVAVEVESFDSASGAFRVHFTRAGRHAVPSGDVPGVPEPVRAVAERYDDVLAFYRDELGFRAPISDEALADNGGDGRFDVYLVDFAGVGDGHYSREACRDDNPQQCTGYMAQENDFAGYGYPSFDYAVRILASHEFFHAIQAAYDADQGSVIAEGTAVWATEKYDPSLRDFEGFASGYFANPGQPIDLAMTGPVDAFSYGAGVFFQFLDERYGTEIIPALWEACVNGAEGEADPQWLSALDALLQRAYDTTFADALAELAQWNLFTRDYADADLGFANGRLYPEVAMKQAPLPFQDDRMRINRASIAYWRFPLGQRAVLTAALVGDDDDLAGLRLFVSGRKDGVQSVPVEIEPRGAEPVELAVGGLGIVHVVNTNLEGTSRRPGLCAGHPEEVAACLVALGAQPPEPEPDAGVEPAPDLGVAVDSGVPMTDAGPGGDPDAENGGDDEGGCAATPGPGPWALLLGLLPLVRRRRRR